MAGNDPPAVGSDANFVVRLEAQERKGQLGNAASILVASPFERGGMVGGHAMSAKQRRNRGDAETTVLVGDRMRREIFRLRHRDGAPEALTQPSCVAEVIGMVVGCNHTGDRASGERRREVRIPQGTGGCVAVTA